MRFFCRHRRNSRRIGLRRCSGQCRQIGLARQDGGQKVGHAVARKRGSAGEHFVEHAAECPDVGARVERLAGRLLGAHVGGGTEDNPRVRHRGGRDRRRLRGICRAIEGFDCLRQTEVHHLDRAIGPNLDVGRLQIPVDDSLLVRGVEGFRDLARDGQGLADRNRPAGEAFGEILALDQLHDKGGDAVRLFDAEEAADVRVVQRGQRLCFPMESCDAVRVGRERRGQDLDRDTPIEPRVEGQYTSPMPPAPSAEMISYGPIRTPEVRRANERSYGLYGDG